MDAPTSWDIDTSLTGYDPNQIGCVVVIKPTGSEQH